MLIRKKSFIRNRIAKILGVKRKEVISEANLILDLGADFFDMKEIAMSIEDVTGNDCIEGYVEIEKVEDVFKLCGV